MKSLLKFLLIYACVLCVFRVPVTSQAATPPDRQVAITIDDLPAPPSRCLAATITEMTIKLLDTLRDQKVPVVGFVNEQKLYKRGEVDERINALRLWLDHGFELGNHTFSHMSLNQAGLKAWEDDVVQGESVTQILLAEHNMKLRYFRHPFLDTGRDLQTRREAEAFLTARGYHIAPVTLDAWDWMYAGVYEDAKKRGDAGLQQQLVPAICRTATKCLPTRNGCRNKLSATNRNKSCYCTPINWKPTTSPNCSTLCANEAIASSAWKRLSAIRPTDCLTLMSERRVPAGSITGPSPRASLPKARRCFRNG